MIRPDQKIVLSFSGFSCNGKTTAANMILERNPGMYLVAFDKQKWQFSGYDRSKDSVLIKEITRDLFELICQKSLPIVLMTPMRTKETYEEHKAIAEKYGYEFHFIHPNAPLPVLMERFRERVARAEAKQSKISSWIMLKETNNGNSSLSKLQNFFQHRT